MHRRIIYLINPISGTSGKSSLKEVIARETEKAKISFSIYDTRADGDYQFLRSLIAEERITDIVICGGDGTISAVTAGLQGVSVNIGIIPMGSGNGLAFSAGIPKQPLKALDIIFRGKASEVDGFLVNNRFSCMLCGIGFDALVAHEFAKQKKRGLQTYVKVSVINFFKADPYPFTIEAGGKSFDTEAFFISIANSNQFGNNFTIAPRASLCDGLLDIVIVKKMSKFMLPFSVLSQVVGINAVHHISEYATKRNILYMQVPELKIRNTGFAPIHIDGDPSDTSAEFLIRIIPKAFRLIQP
jgi:diacylglycerol kinase (ATP)